MACFEAFVIFAMLPAVAVSNKGKTLNFTEEHINNVVAGHNHLRTHNATPVASDMRQITWDEELALISSSWSSGCNYQMNPDAITDRWGELGQSFYVSKRGTEWEKDFHFMALLKWLWQKRNYNYEAQECKEGTFCLEYMNLMAANTYKVGCGASTCPEMRASDPEEGEPIFYTCVYGPKGLFNASHMSRPYSAGDPCTGCEANDTCLMKMCANQVRDSAVKYVKKPPPSEDAAPSSGPLAGAAAAVAIIIGIMSSVLVYLKKFRKILPTNSAADGAPSTELQERAESGDGNSRPASPVMEAKFREAEGNSSPTPPETDSISTSPKVASVEPLIEANKPRVGISETSKPSIEPLMEVDEPTAEVPKPSQPKLKPLIKAEEPNVKSSDINNTPQRSGLENQGTEDDTK